MTATTAKGILPDSTGKGKRRQLSTAHKAKLVAALAKWRAGLSDEDREALKERTREAQQARWNAVSEREKRERLAASDLAAHAPQPGPPPSVPALAAARTRLLTCPFAFTHALAVIDQDELRQAFLALAGEIAEPYELAGVTFHGPEAHREWVAFLSSNDADEPGDCEGWGDTPLEALNDLRRHMREEHPSRLRS